MQMTSALQLEGLVTKKPRVGKYTLKPAAVSSIEVFIMHNITLPLPCLPSHEFSQRCQRQARQRTVSTPPMATPAFSWEPTRCLASSIETSCKKTWKLTPICQTTQLCQVNSTRVQAWIFFNPCTPTGDCDDSDSASIKISFRGFDIAMFFEKTPGEILASVHSRDLDTLRFRWRAVVRQPSDTCVLIQQSAFRARRPSRSKRQTVHIPARLPLPNAHRKVIRVHAGEDRHHVRSGNVTGG